MKKFVLNPLAVVFFFFATLLVSINAGCTGKASNNGNNTTTTDETSAAKTAVLTLDAQSFDARISTGVTLVDFWATWCRPCRMQGPVIEEVSKDMAGKVTVGKLDIDDNPDIAARYGVESIPNMIIFKDGKVVGQFIGLTEKDELVKALNNHLKK